MWVQLLGPRTYTWWVLLRLGSLPWEPNLTPISERCCSGLICGNGRKRGKKNLGSAYPFEMMLSSPASVSRYSHPRCGGSSPVCCCSTLPKHPCSTVLLCMTPQHPHCAHLQYLQGWRRLTGQLCLHSIPVSTEHRVTMQTASLHLLHPLPGVLCSPGSSGGLCKAHPRPLHQCWEGPISTVLTILTSQYFMYQIIPHPHTFHTIPKQNDG